MRKGDGAGHRGFKGDHDGRGGSELTNAGCDRAGRVGRRACAAESNVAGETAERAQLQRVGDARAAACDGARW